MDLEVHLRETMKRRSTEELLQLLSSNGKEYSEEARQIVREELSERGVDVPRQDTRRLDSLTHEAQGVRNRHFFSGFRPKSDDTNLRKMAFASVLLPIVAWVSQPVIAREIRVPEVLLIAALIQFALFIGGLYCGTRIVSRGRNALPAFEWWLALVGIVISGGSVLLILGAAGLLILLRAA
jgi:hypothetical protein